MRIVGLLAGSIALIALVGGYLEFARSLRSTAAEFKDVPAPGLFTIELTPSFTPRASAFGGIEPQAMEVRLQGQTIWQTTTSWPAGRSARVSNVQGFVVGRNELWCAAFAQDAAPGDDFDRLDVGGESRQGISDVGSDAGVAAAAMAGELRGLRVRVFRDQHLLVEQTLWSVPGGVPAGVISVAIPPPSDVHSDGHFLQP